MSKSRSNRPNVLSLAEGVRGFRSDQAERFKELERENVQLKKLVANQALNIATLKEATSGNF